MIVPAHAFVMLALERVRAARELMDEVEDDRLRNARDEGHMAHGFGKSAHDAAQRCPLGPFAQ